MERGNPPTTAGERYEWAKRAGRQHRLKPAARHLLVTIAMRAGNPRKPGHAWPSVATLAADTGMSERSVFRLLSRLKEMRLISPTRQEPGRTVEYRIDYAARPLNRPKRVDRRRIDERRTGQFSRADLTAKQELEKLLGLNLSQTGSGAA